MKVELRPPLSNIWLEFFDTAARGVGSELAHILPFSIRKKVFIPVSYLLEH